MRPEWRAKRDYKAYVFSDLLVVASRNLLGGGFALKLRSRHTALCVALRVNLDLDLCASCPCRVHAQAALHN